VSRFIVQLQPTDECVGEVVAPVEKYRRVGSMDMVTALELDDGVEISSARHGAGGRPSIHCGHVGRREHLAAATVRPSGLARLRPTSGWSQP
jgi:hypothetical protein